MKNQITQTLTIDFSQTREVTPEGFLKVEILAGKAGVQQYTCNEMRNMGVDVKGDGIINVARLPEDVFSPESLATLDNIDITELHPGETIVNANNFSRVSKGHVTSPGIRENNHIRVKAIIKDKSLVERINSGRNQVSLGYRNHYIKQSGEFDGMPFTYVMKNIKYNHLASVPGGRAQTAVVLDSAIEEDIMSKELEAKITALEAENKQLKADNENKNQQATIDIAIEKGVKERTEIITQAKNINSEIVINDKDNESIMREVLGDKITTDNNIDVVKYAFFNLKKKSKHKSINLGNPQLSNDEESRAAKKQDYMDKRFNQEGFK
jgi:hypothetical protein